MLEQLAQPRVLITQGPPYKLEIFLQDQLIPWKRAGRNGKRYYDPQSQEKLHWSLIFNKYFDRKPLKGPVGLHLEFRIKPPRTLAAKHGQLLEGVDHDRVPDIDNLEKFVLDALTGIVWSDDCQVSVSSKRKFWSYDPGTLITIFEIPRVLIY